MSEKWWDMSDDELDDLFREASDKADIPFDSSALDKLRQKMDFKPMPPAQPVQGFKKRWIALAGLLIFFGVALLYTFSNKSGESKQTKVSEIVGEKTTATAQSKQVEISEFISEKTPTKTKVEKEKELGELGNLPNSQKSETVANKKNFSKAKTSPDGNSTNANVIKSNIAQNKTSTGVENTLSKKIDGNIENKEKNLDFPVEKTSSKLEKTKSISDNNYPNNKPLEVLSTKSNEIKSTTTHELNGNNLPTIKQEKSNNEVNSSVNSYSSNKTNRKKARLTNSKFGNGQANNSTIYLEANALISTPVITSENSTFEEKIVVKNNFNNVDFLANKATKQLQINNVESESPTYVDAPPIVMKQPKFSRFGIRLAVAPEINSIEKMETSAVIGSMFALLLEYRLTKKLTLQTGINYSKKKYTGDFEYYYAWVNASPQPKSIDGICKVIDIPINLRLNAFQKNRNTFFVSGGISSYLMSDEVYTYNYAWGLPKVKDWTGNASNFYWSTLNLSAGVERKLNKNFTLQVEPFLKTPLVGVGRGLVNLYSSGILFSTKYEF